MLKKLIFLLFAAVLLQLGLASCQKNSPIYSLDDIQGEWIRIQSNKPIYDSMVVEIDQSIGRVLNISPNNYFSLGEIKWRDISPSSDSTFSYEDLGSDGNYYSGRLILSKNTDNIDLLFVLPEAYSGPNGDEQVWVRR